MWKLDVVVGRVFLNEFPYAVTRQCIDYTILDIVYRLILVLMKSFTKFFR